MSTTTRRASRGSGSSRRRTAVVASVSLAALASSLAAPVAASDVPAGTGNQTVSTEIDVVVRAAAGRVDEARTAFAALGGTIDTDLPIIDGFSGSIDPADLARLDASAAIVSVTPDQALAPMSTEPTLGYDRRDTGSMSAITRITGAQRLWDAGFVGQGIDVAVIDTGVTRVPGLDAPGKVLDGPDLSFDSLDEGLVSRDAFGHGTHMAGIIAGSDVAPGTSGRRCRTCTGRSAYTDTTKFVGLAPEARVINVKVGAYDGAADVSQVIAAIDWVVQHRADPGVNIRVLNLSFGTDSTQDPALDPLVFAAEQAWRAGIVVVASAGNEGLASGAGSALATPAVSPSIIAVGASDPRGTITTSDDVIPDFAQHGSPARGVDVVAPGVSVIGLRVPGGFIDTNVGTGRVGERFQRATGTSQATAVVSGLVALLLSRSPQATPDMIKAYLTGNAKPLDGDESDRRNEQASSADQDSTERWYAGAGSAFVGGSRRMPAVTAPAPSGTGLGSLEASRGSYHVTNGETELHGEVDIFGAPWDPAAWTAASGAQAAWSGGVWNGNRWTGDGWGDTGWVNVTWTGDDTTADDWAGVRWKGVRWKGVIWDGVRWKGADWTSGQWTSGGWSGVRWRGVVWSDAAWS
ncbi:MAG: S8 family serine peptidase [Actinobacteria bacterium]|nr:S8 family serine peptidase [Actinomycetota bacterium]